MSSEEKNRPFIHPFNFYIVDYGVESTHRLIMEGKLTDAAKNLLLFLGWLDPDIQKKLNKEMYDLYAMWKGQKPFSFEDLFSIIVKVSYELHDKGYFLMAKAVKKVMVGYEEGMAPEVKT